MVMSKIQDLIAKYQFWYATRYIKVDKHYTFFVDLAGKDGSFAIKFLKKYDGVIVEYSNVQVNNDGMLNFDFDIISNVNNCNLNTKRFVRFTQNVMRSIIYNAVENAMKEDNENRNTDLVESGSQREVYEEVASISEERLPDRKSRKKTVRRNKSVHSEV